MDIVHLKHPHGVNKHICLETVLALGYFDGVHVGHQKVIRTAVEVAKENNMKSAVMTFHPHPSVVLGRKNPHVEYISPIPDKAKIIDALGVDTLYVVKFDLDFAELLPQEFVDQYLINLNIKHVVAGFDYTYGRLGKGTMETLPFHSRGFFTQTVVEKVKEDDQKVSSTLIRELLREGHVDKLLPLLGRYYTVEGKVIDGDKRGRTIGFPTANIKPVENYIIPQVGVYAVEIFINQIWHQGVCNIGYKPTFNRDIKELTIEVHVFDFNDTIYGENVLVKWHKRIRPEEKFSSIEDLISQINKDKCVAKKYFQQIL